MGGGAVLGVLVGGLPRRVGLEEGGQHRLLMERIFFVCFTAGWWRTDSGMDLLCFALLQFIALGSTSEIWVVWLSLSLSLDSASYSLAIPDGFSGDGGAERGIRYGT